MQFCQRHICKVRCALFTLLTQDVLWDPYNNLEKFETIWMRHFGDMPLAKTLRSVLRVFSISLLFESQRSEIDVLGCETMFYLVPMLFSIVSIDFCNYLRFGQFLFFQLCRKSRKLLMSTLRVNKSLHFAVKEEGIVVKRSLIGPVNS